MFLLCIGKSGIIADIAVKTGKIQAMAKTSTSFKPGQSGNPDGRPPKEWTWSGVLREMMEQSEEDGEPVKVKIARALKLKAYTGDVQAIKELGDRIDGKPQQKTDITTNGKDLPTPLLGGLTNAISNNNSNSQTVEVDETD